jgi:pimeloyl-ACP methyl ester carboxylesterase
VRKLVAAAATAGLVSGFGLLGASSASAAPAADPSDAFKPANLNWHGCQEDIVAGARALDGLSPVKVSQVIQCAELQVPLDYAHPQGQKITLELTKVPHTGSGEAKGDIVVNPGGPGGGGALFGPRVYAQNSAPMQAAYNVIGFDPRGVGFSTPKLTCDTNYSNAPRPPYGTGGEQDEATWLKISKDYADACARKFGAGAPVNLLDHIKTIDSVRDMNTIRAALGREKLDYYGASYGTYLGQVYATVFPKRVGRMVLDGNVTPKNVWYDAQLTQDIAFDKNIEYYFGWIAKFDNVYHLGDTQPEVRKFFYDLEAELAAKPVMFTDPGSGTEIAVGPDELVDVILNAGYRRSQAVWHSFASGLSAYKAGDMETFAGTFGAPTTGGSDDNGFAVYLGVQCTDVQWPLSWKKWHNDAVRTDRKAPFETWGNVWFNAPCLYWGAKPGTPVDVGQTRDLPKNILMFQSTADAATPYAGALELHKILKGSHLVVQDGDRTHCIVHRGDLRPGGVDSYFDAYFLNGTLPEKETVHVSELGDPTPPGAGAAARTLESSTSQSTPQFDVIK